jgi:hypothetical protein
MGPRTCAHERQWTSSRGIVLGSGSGSGLGCNIVTKRNLEAKYEQGDLHKVAASASHLAVEEQSHLHEALTEYSDLFDGTLGKWNMGAYDIELRPEATP